MFTTYHFTAKNLYRLSKAMFRVLTCLGTEHDWRLVIVAGVVCLLASLTAISLVGRARAASGRARATWIVAAGTATGCGIWATHFIAMLAYDPGVSVAYNVGLTALSLMVAVAITSMGLAVAVYGNQVWGAPAGGAIVGAGVACMHYLGMWAVELPGRFTWSFDLVAVSVILGMLLGIAALTIAVRRDDIRSMLLAALFLTLAIVSHHFTAMGAIEIVPDPARIITALSLSPTALALVVANAAIAILGISLVSAFADRRLGDKSLLLATALNNMSQSLCMFDAEQRLVVCNERYREMYGLSPEQVKPGTMLRQIFEYRIANGLFAGESPAEHMRQVVENRITHGVNPSANPAESVPERGALVTTYSKHIREFSDGRTISVVNQPVAGGGWVAMHEDITEKRQLEQERNRNQRFLDLIIEHVPAPIFVKEAGSLRYVLVNRAGENFWGISRAEMLGKTSGEIFGKEEAELIVARDEQLLQSDQPHFDEREIRTPYNGIRSIVSKRLVVSDDDGKSQYVVGVIEDVTERKLSEKLIAHQAHHDALTDLPNRVLFREQLEQSLKRVHRRERLAVLYLDLDQFKTVNDTLGHPAGDELLKAIAARLRSCVRDTDIVARLGGDEFAIIQTAIAEPTDAIDLVTRIHEAIRQPCEFFGHQLVADASIGIAIAPDDGTEPDQLLKNADLAMYGAKADGRGTYRFFEPAMDSRMKARRALEFDMRQAITGGEFELYYQPLINLRNNKITGCEALLRWHHSKRGMISPAEFIPIAEETGLIVPLGEWVLRTACAEAVTWPDDIKVAVNVSPVQFKSGNLVQMVINTLGASRLPAHRLELELTEAVLIRDDEAALALLHQLRAFGVRIVMDDFGTGYSSLSYLQRFPFDKIKIDRSFIKDVAEVAGTLSIVQAVVSIAASRNITTTAEGVETEHQLELLRTLGCTEMQGFLFSRPIPATEIMQLLLSRREKAVSVA
jgi:diguanylate cyclase (GGDEF)-like protein/PAS domain S-box-containing protein